LSINAKFTLEAIDFETPSNMKTVFISASPVLVNEVNRYYITLRDALIAYLKKKETNKKNVPASGETTAEEESAQNIQETLIN
jgi:hypothetical protein